MERGQLSDGGKGSTFRRWKGVNFQTVERGQLSDGGKGSTFRRWKGVNFQTVERGQLSDGGKGSTFRRWKGVNFQTVERGQLSDGGKGSTFRRWKGVNFQTVERGQLSDGVDKGLGVARADHTFETKSAAEAWLIDQMARSQRGAYADPALGRLAFADWVPRWQAARVHLRPSTRATADSLMRNHVLPYFGPRPLARVQTDEVEAFVSTLIGKGLAPSTI